MKADGGSAGVEGAGIGANNSLAEIGDLQTLVLKIALDKLRHRPLEEQSAGLYVISEALFIVVKGGCVVEPQITRAGGAERIAQAAKHIVHRAPAIDIARGKRAHFLFAAVV